MSQNVSTNPKEREPSIAPTPIQPWSAEAEADKLMDELFSDLDQILEGGNRLPTEPAQPEYVSLKSIVIPQIPAPPAVVPPPEKLSETPSPESTDSKLSERVETQIVATSNSRPNGFSLSLERLLLLLGVVVLGMSIILLLVKQKRLTLPEWFKPTPTPTVHTSQVSEADAQFANYMLRSLEVIDNKNKAKQQATTPPGGTAANPPAVPSGNPPVAASPPQRVIERVYIPVYPPQNPGAAVAPPAGVRPQAPTLSAPAPSSGAKAPSPSAAVRRVVPSPSPAARRAAPSPSPVARRAAPSPSPVARRAAPSPSPAARRAAPSPFPVARRAAPSPSPVAKRAVPASPQAAAPRALPALPPLPPSVIVPTAPVTQLPTSASKHTLVGVLEQGERSAALFNAAGVTRYIFVGEAIGDSGWTLVSIANQEAVIRRNGEVRSVYAGQSF
ncbi:hypothetical protein NDI39_14140 [Microcoleus sp. ZQ-A2]|nr:hypothetical protein [Microcoleus sp. FACHB-1]